MYNAKFVNKLQNFINKYNTAYQKFLGFGKPTLVKVDGLLGPKTKSEAIKLFGKIPTQNELDNRVEKLLTNQLKEFQLKKNVSKILPKGIVDFLFVNSNTPVQTGQGGGAAAAAAAIAVKTIKSIKSVSTPKTINEIIYKAEPVDFEIVAKKNKIKKMLLIGGGVAAAALAAYFIFKKPKQTINGFLGISKKQKSKN